MTTAFRARLGVAALDGAAAAVLAGCSDSGDGSGKNPFAVGSPTSSAAATTESSDAPVESEPAPDGWRDMTCDRYIDELSGATEQIAIWRELYPTMPEDKLSAMAFLQLGICLENPDMPLGAAVQLNMPDP